MNKREAKDREKEKDGREQKRTKVNHLTCTFLFMPAPALVRIGCPSNSCLERHVRLGACSFFASLTWTHALFSISGSPSASNVCQGEGVPLKDLSRYMFLVRQNKWYHHFGTAAPPTGF